MLDKLLNFMAVPRGPSEMGAFNGLAQGLGKKSPTDLHKLSAPQPKPFRRWLGAG